MSNKKSGGFSVVTTILLILMFGGLAYAVFNGPIQTTEIEVPAPE